MRRAAVRFAIAGSLCVLAVALLPAQTTRERPLTYHEQIFLGNESLHKELKLTAEQAKKITAFRDKWVPAYINEAVSGGRTGTPSVKLGTMIKEAEKFASDTLDAKQRTRLRQVVLQQLASSPSRYLPDEAVADLKLTPKQKNDLFAKGGTIEGVLTAEQKETWKKLIGDPFAQGLARQVPGAPGTAKGKKMSGSDRSRTTFGKGKGRTPPTPEVMRALHLARALEDIGATPDQKTRLSEARTAWETATKDYSTWATADRPGKLEKATLAYEKAIAATLQPGQMNRIEQILMQQELRGADHLQRFLNAKVVAKLEMTDAQKKQRDEILEQHRKELVRLLLGGGDPAGMQEKTAALHKDTRTRMEGTLTPVQRDRLDKLFGPDFATTMADRFGGATRATTTTATLFTREMSYLRATELAGIFKWNDAQAKKVADLYARYTQERRTIGTTEAAREQLTRKYEKELVDLLGANQRNRYRQIVLQVLEGQPLTVRSFILWSLPEVVKDLELTPAQRTELARGSNADTVLSADQQKRWKAMKGESYKGTLTTRLGGPANTGTSARNTNRIPTLPVRMSYLIEKSVQTDLKLTNEQVTALEALQTKWNQDVSGYRTWKVEERTGKIDTATKAVEDGLTRLLQPAQVRRLEQIQMQNLRPATPFATQGTSVYVATPGALGSRGESSLQLLLQYPPATKKLGLTDRQNEQIRTTVSDGQRVTALIRTELARLSATRGDDLTSTTQATHRQQIEKKLRSLLTDKQQETVKELLGEPFKGTFTSRWGRGGGGLGGTDRTRPDRGSSIPDKRKR